MRFSKGKKFLADFKEKSYTKLMSFDREDIFDYERFEERFYNKLYERLFNKKKKTIRHGKSSIAYKRYGTLLLSEHTRSKKNSGDHWIRDTLELFNTTYLWNNNYYMDEILQINANKLSPNLSSTKKFLTLESYALLTNNNLNNKVINDDKYLI